MLRDNINKISKIDIPIEIVTKSIKNLLKNYKRLSQYLIVIAQMYPASLYYERIMLMKRLIADGEVIYGSKIQHNGRLFIDHPIVDYVKIKRETGVCLYAPTNIVSEYNKVRKQYNIKLRSAIDKLLKI
jgi:hypothetical protein